jgi:hypothetical protein
VHPTVSEIGVFPPVLPCLHILHTMQAWSAYMVQYTIRNIPEAIDRRLRELAKSSGQSLNEETIRALYRGTGLADTSAQYDDLDDLAGSLVHDPEFDKALSEQDTVDAELWR